MEALFWPIVLLLHLQSKNQLLSQADPNFISRIITSAQSSSYNLEMKLQLFRDRAHSFIAREYIISELRGLLHFSTGNFPGIGGKTFRRTAVYANMSLHLREWKDTFGRKYTYFTTTMMLDNLSHLMNHLHNTVYLFYNFLGTLFFLHGELTHRISSLQWKEKNSLHTAVCFLPVNCRSVLPLALLLQHPSCYSLFGWC